MAIGPTIGGWEVAHDVSEWIEIAAVTVIAVTVVVSIAVMLRAAVTGEGAAKSLWVFKQAFSRGVLLGLDLLIAADIIRTVTLDPTPRTSPHWGCSSSCVPSCRGRSCSRQRPRVAGRGNGSTTPT